MNKRLFITGLPSSTTSDELKTLFLSTGKVVSAIILTDKDSGISKGFGFIEMETENEVQNAILKLNGSDFGGGKISVSRARPKENKDNHHRKFNGGFMGQKKLFGKRREGGRGNFGRRESNGK